MKIRLGSKRCWLVAILLAMAALIGPSLFSRLASPWRVLRVVATSDALGLNDNAPGTPLRIASYNIAHGRGLAESNWEGGDQAERLERLDRIAELLLKINADVVVLNEVDFDSSWSHSVNQAAYLAQKAGYPHRFEQRSFDLRVAFWTWRFGNAILSKHPITNARIVDAPGYSRWETLLIGKKRNVVGDIQFGDETIRLVGAHLSHRSEALRVEAARKLIEIAETSPWPTLVVGDLNSTPPGYPESNQTPNGNNAIMTFDESGLFQRSPSEGPLLEMDLTFHSMDPRRVIDWILIPRAWEFQRYRVDPSQHSDHRLVYADVMPDPMTTPEDPD
ncbi:MAG: endonuclease/exonuclease/phosphatase family protein [Planctomycetota bacterium]|nr:endonuclease/exonuclease/phosphatase family protein [Planctomycetota bacterium]